MIVTSDYWHHLPGGVAGEQLRELSQLGAC
jgi:hypothetical protein